MDRVIIAGGKDENVGIYRRYVNNISDIRSVRYETSLRLSFVQNLGQKSVMSAIYQYYIETSLIKSVTKSEMITISQSKSTRLF